MKRAITMLLALTLSAAAIGCGSESDEDQVRGTVEDFAAANVDKDWSGACALMTEQARKGLAAAGAALGGTGCAGVLKAAISQLPADRVKKEFEDLKIKDIKVDGDEATVTVNGEKTKMVKEGETWLLDFEPTG
jgi:hypothetical protein